MLGFGRARGRMLRLAVDGGRVRCPREGDADVELCLACGYADELDETASLRVVTCRWQGERTSGPIDLFDRAWDGRA